MAWLCFNDAFLSVVNHRSDQRLLVVRARKAEMGRSCARFCICELLPIPRISMLE